MYSKKKVLTRECLGCGETKAFPADQKGCSAACAVKIRRGGLEPEPAEKLIDDLKISGDEATIVRRSFNRVRTDEELIAECGIDTNKWYVKEWSCGAWETAMKIRKNGEDEPFQVQSWRITAKLQRNRPAEAVNKAVDQLLETYAKRAPTKFNIIKAVSKSGVALELGPYDHHFAALAWSKETNYPNWDLDISNAFWHDAIGKILGRVVSPKLEKVFLVLGNDMMHVDSPKNMTFNNTPQDMDSRWDLMVEHVINAAVGSTDHIVEHVAPVELILVPGNHDKSSVRWLGRLLQAHYRHNKHVTVNTGPSEVRTIQWGRNFTVLHHGEAVGSQSKRVLSALGFADTYAQQCAESPYREIHTGHYHHEEAHNYPGWTYRILRTMTPPTKWASDNRYVGSGRGAEGFEIDKEEGLIGSPRYNIPAHQERPSL